MSGSSPKRVPGDSLGSVAAGVSRRLLSSAARPPVPSALCPLAGSIGVSESAHAGGTCHKCSYQGFWWGTAVHPRTSPGRQEPSPGASLQRTPPGTSRAPSQVRAVLFSYVLLPACRSLKVNGWFLLR